MADSNLKASGSVVNGSTANNSVKNKGLSADKKEKAKELTDKFVQLREEALKKGLSEKEIRESFLRPSKSRDLRRLLSNKTFQTQVLVLVLAVTVAVKFGLKDFVHGMIYDSRCLISNNIVFSEIARPLADCEVCRNLKSVPIERHISAETFLEQYAYTKIPLLVKDATTNWTAMSVFTYDFFKKLYTETEGALVSVEEECQFFPYKTEFSTLEEAFNMSDARARYEPGEEPWYFGWSNCHKEVADKLRQHYRRPYFLPNDSESSSIDWLFMGGPGIGAFIHLDSVGRPSWQAQISGAKTWQMIPSPECESVCHEINITVEKGDIFVFDSNEWYHATFVEPGELSITIGSEYD
ncbi:bifunctional arginine demethylase and lysyl-hydroxylase PSR-like [Gigantopelta aegis]|uniref:bifunctional arginine demethylase and lysyl-hydroxylase PSR-like n=1 Tax=Gigantopelta aegis TaxID=1735272 RepID=UPI001B88AA6D|nr:bifunctional arginine demethylase and lysyl-hydroxylase PSR-like [Gigantopelta aegis]XP_041362575.1 bifunctional arginine demethylase and lysyl-hydroxylase PSR-like [Gigantopelta aegis]